MKIGVNIIYKLFFLIPFLSFASNFNKVNGSNNKNWPLEMNSAASFDIASKCEMLVFIEVLNEYSSLSESVLILKIKAKNANIQSVNKWKKETKIRILTNFGKLSNESLKEVIFVTRNSSWETLSLIGLQKSIPKKFLNWYKKTKLFYTDYVREQLRLAALFPSVTSEIIQFSDNEIQGHNLLDKNFLLTFDDGPTKVSGNTDKLIKVLDTHNLNAMFFVLGESLQKRLIASSVKSLNNLYGQNSVFSHGKIHKSHQRYALWKESIDYTNNLIHKVFTRDDKNELLYFRPPYGQRNKALVDYFTSKNSKIIFWNIDSRDWSSKLNVAQVAERQIKLMLLWRNGVLLFHDIHAKAQKAVPIIHNFFKNTDITWMNPNEF